MLPKTIDQINNISQMSTEKLAFSALTCSADQQWEEGSNNLGAVAVPPPEFAQIVLPKFDHSFSCNIPLI